MIPKWSYLLSLKYSTTDIDNSYQYVLSLNYSTTDMDNSYLTHTNIN